MDRLWSQSLLHLGRDGAVLARADLPEREFLIRYGRRALRVAGDGTAWIGPGARILGFAPDRQRVGPLPVAPEGDEVGSFLLLRAWGENTSSRFLRSVVCRTEVLARTSHCYVPTVGIVSS